MAEKLVLVRHGQIGANRDGRWHGSTDSPLTWRGRRQAKRTAKTLMQRGHAFEAIYVSPLGRCRNTAAPSAKMFQLEAQVHHDLREWSIGDWEDLPFSFLAREHDFMNEVRRNPEFTPPGDGESLLAVASRLVPALQNIHKAHEGSVLVVSHGACLAVALAHLLDADVTQWSHYLCDNCGLTELVLEPQPHVNYFNRTEHL